MFDIALGSFSHTLRAFITSPSTIALCTFVMSEVGMSFWGLIRTKQSTAK